MRFLCWESFHGLDLKEPSVDWGFRLTRAEFDCYICPQWKTGLGVMELGAATATPHQAALLRVEPILLQHGDPEDQLRDVEGEEDVLYYLQGLGWGSRALGDTYIHTYIHTDIHTYRQTDRHTTKNVSRKLIGPEILARSPFSCIDPMWNPK